VAVIWNYLCDIVSVQYVWKMFSWKHFWTEIDATLEVFVVSPINYSVEPSFYPKSSAATSMTSGFGLHFSFTQMVLERQPKPSVCNQFTGRVLLIQSPNVFNKKF
jgi:hypothetical protein